MKANELKAGYLLKLTEKRNGKSIAKVEYNDLDELCISGPDTWFPLKELDDDLRYEEYVQIDEVYGRTYNRMAYEMSFNDRKLLWSREMEEGLEREVRIMEEIELLENKIRKLKEEL